MQIHKRISFWVILCVCVVLVAAQSWAQSGQQSGTAGATELLIPVGSVGSALGGANMAYTSGVDAIHWNPAGAAVSPDKFQVMVSHLKYIGDTNVNYVAGVFKTGSFGALGFSFKTLDFGEIAVTSEDAPDGTGEVFSPNFIIMGLTYSRSMTDRINFGTNIKVISEKILRETATGVAFDFGIQYRTNIGAAFGVTLKNLGPNMKFDGSDLEITTDDQSGRPDAEDETFRIPSANFELPTSLEIGLSYVANFNESNHLTMMGSFMNSNFGFDEYRLAAEYNLGDFVFLRGSYVLGYDSNDEKLRSSDDRFIFGPSVGGGLNLKVGETMNLNFDYAYRVTELFDANQWVSLRIGF